LNQGLDLVLFKVDKHPSLSPFNISVYFFASENTHSGEVDPIDLLIRQIEVTFLKDSEESHRLRLFDSLISLFLLVAALFAVFALLIMTGLTHRDMTFSWLVVRFIPFGIVYLIFAAGLLSYHALVDADPLAETERVSSLFALARGIALAVYFVADVIAGVTVFQPSFAWERREVVPLGLTLFVVIFVLDIASAKSKYAELKFRGECGIKSILKRLEFIEW
jgi:hypothetical protein